MTDSYEKLKQKNFTAFHLLQWHFSKVLKSIHRNISSREKFWDPWTIEVKREVQYSIFYEFFKALDAYKTSFGRTLTVEKDSKKLIKNIRICFHHLGSLINHLCEVTTSSKMM
jgi:hypothetical protein